MAIDAEAGCCLNIFMSSTGRHSIRHLELRNAQVLSRQCDCWKMLRQAINDLKTKELKSVIALGRQTEKDIRLSLAMDRMYQVRESQPIFLVNGLDMQSLTQSNANRTTGVALQLEQLEIAEMATSSFSIVDSPSIAPPGVTNLRQTPRRPGAPSVAPALINPLLDQCGSVHVAPETRLS